MPAFAIRRPISGASRCPRRFSGRSRSASEARSFYRDNKRVSNARIKAELGVSLAYPDYKTGLKALLAEA